MLVSINRIFRLACLGLAALGLASCGGSGGGGFSGPDTPSDTINISITADKTTIPANITGQPPNLALPFTNTFTVRVTQEDTGALFAADPVSVDLAPGLPQGALFFLDGDPDHEDDNGVPLAFRRLVFEKTTGIVTGHFHSSTEPGLVTLTASVTDPVSGRTVSASMNLTVTGVDRPVSSLAFGGPFINAVLAGNSTFGPPPSTNGTYSRIVSVTATGPDGNPARPGTPINFFLIDGPLTGYPDTGSGSFSIAGPNGNPLEGDFQFSAPDGQFRPKGARRFDRLVLDGTKVNLPDNRDLTGTRTIDAILSETQLSIDRRGPAFAQNPDNGNTVPYIIGRAQNGNILSPSFTNLAGVAETVLTYPVFRIGQTAILVACTSDNVVCTVLNRCDADGANCGAVYLATSNGQDRVLTASETTLAANSTSNVKLCLEDVNGVPIVGEPITYDIGAKGAAVVTINGNDADTGSLITGADGCVTATIVTTGQIEGSDEITITFDAEDIAPGSQPVITINPPGAGQLQCVAVASAAGGVVDIRLVDNNGSPIPGTFISHTVAVAGNPAPEPAATPPLANPPPSAVVTYNPASQLTDDEGKLTANVATSNLLDPGDAVTVTFSTPSGTSCDVTFFQDQDVR